MFEYAIIILKIVKFQFYSILFHIIIIISHSSSSSSRSTSSSFLYFLLLGGIVEKMIKCFSGAMCSIHMLFDAIKTNRFVTEL